MNLTACLRSQLPKPQRQILESITRMADGLKVRAYLAGGSVRDLLLHRPNPDLDVVIEGEAGTFAKYVSSLLSAQVKLFPRFNTATLTLPGGARVDIAMSRSETYPQPGALPQVDPAELKQDLFRRDFTINAMAVVLNREGYGRLIDHFGGMEDLAAKQIRILHEHSFIDDPTRVFRAARFEQRLGFKLEPDTLRRLRAAVAGSGIKRLSGDRVRHELQKVWQEPKPWLTWKRLTAWGALDQVLKGWRVSAAALAQLQKVKPALAQAAALGFTALDPACVHFLILAAPLSKALQPKLAERLSLTAEWRQALEQARHERDLLQMLRRAKPLHQQPGAIAWLRLRPEVVWYWRTKTAGVVKSRLERLLKHWHAPEPVSSAADLQKWGVPPGPLVGEALAALTLAKLEGKMPTTRLQEKYVREHFSAKA